MGTTVIVGAGAAGLSCAKRLREIDADRSIVVIDKDADAPYERPPLSKGLAGDGARRADASAGLPAELVTGAVVSVDVGGRTVVTDSGRVAFDQLVIAPGSVPHRPAWAVGNVLTLHTHADSVRLRERARSARTAIVIGGGYIGAEVAASLAAVGVATSLVFRDAALFARKLGHDVSAAVTSIHRHAGVTLLPGRHVVEIEGDPKRSTLLLSDGERIDADLVVAGLGSAPDTDWLVASGLRGPDGRVQVDACLRAAPSIWAAGDAVTWPGSDGSWRTSAHWTAARSQGRLIAESIATGEARPFQEVPYFWSMQHGSLLQGAGHIDPHESAVEVTTGGTDARPSVLVTYSRAGQARGVIALNEPRGFMAARAALETAAANPSEAVPTL